MSEQSGDLVRVRHKEKKRQKNRVFSYIRQVLEIACAQKGLMEKEKIPPFHVRIPKCVCVYERFMSGNLPPARD